MNLGTKPVTDREINISDSIESARLSGLQLRVIILCALIATLDGFDLQAISIVAPMLTEAWATPAAAFGLVFSAGLFGVMIGQLTVAPLADKYGRKWVIVVATLVFGFFTLSSAWADSVASLTVLRFVTGLGLGAVMPNIIALTSEYSPRRLRATAVMVMFCGVPLGGVIGGFVGAELMSIFGWQSVFYVGGIAPMALAVLLALKLPESLHYLVAAGRPAKDVARILSKISPSLGSAQQGTRFVLGEAPIRGSKFKQLFLNGRAPSTALLWSAYFMNLLMLAFLVNWLPLVLKEAGLPLDSAVLSVAVLNCGGVVGAVFFGRLIDRIGPFGVLGSAFLFGGLTAASLGLVSGQPDLLFPAIFLVGLCVIGGQIGLSALAVATYPTAIRSTGVGWALGIGRIGSIVGPIIGSLLLSTQINVHYFFGFLIIPALAATCAIVLLKRQAHASHAVASVP